MEPPLHALPWYPAKACCSSSCCCRCCCRCLLLLLPAAAAAANSVVDFVVATQTKQTVTDPVHAIHFTRCPLMECIVLDSSSSPPPHPAKGVTEVAGSSSSSSSVESFSEQFTGKAAAVASSKSNPNVPDSDSDSSSSSSSASGSFLSKIATSGGAVQQQSAAADTPFLRKEPKNSYRTIRYFDEADASIT